MKQYISLNIFILVFFITACNNDNSVTDTVTDNNSVSVIDTGIDDNSASVIDTGTDATQSGKATVSGTAAVGAGLKGHSLDLFELDPTNSSQPKLLETITLDESSKFEVSIPMSTDTSSRVFLAQVKDLESPDTVVIESIIFGQDFDKSVKITPFTNLIAKSLLKSETALDLASMRREYDQVASSVVTILNPVAEALGSSLDIDSLLFGDFFVESSGHDELIEAVTFDCNDSNCAVDFASDKVKEKVIELGVETEFTINETLIDKLTQAGFALDELKTSPTADFDFTASIKEAGPVVVLFSYDASWGQPGDSWAGYSGKIKLINLTDTPLDVANKSITMISEKLSMSGAWGAELQEKKIDNNKTKYTFTIPHYAQPLQKDEHRVIGFNGKGIASEVNDLTRCRYENDSCIIKYDDTLSTYVGGSSFVISVDSEEVVEDGDITDDVNESGANLGREPIVDDQNTVIDITLEKSGSPWSTGFNGVIKFISPVATSSWTLTFLKPADVNDISMWSHGGGLQTVGGQSFINVSNKSWNGVLTPNIENSIGASVQGKGTYGAISSDSCTLTLDSTNYPCQLIANENATSVEDLSNINSVGITPAVIIDDNETVDSGNESIVVDNTPTDIPAALVKGSGVTQSKTPKNMTFTSPSDFKGKVVAGYLSDWSVYGRGFDVERLLKDDTFPYNKLVFAFLAICGDQGSLSGKIRAQCAAEGKKDFEVVFLDPWADFGLSVSSRQKGNPYVDGFSKGIIEQLDYIKKRVPNISISASIGGWTMSEPFHRMAANPVHIATFVNSLKELQDKYGFTGFDIDWEFPGHGGASGKFTSNDGQYFKDLVCAVKAGLGDDIEVSSAVGATKTYIGHIGAYYKTIYDQGCLDYIYMMNYDYFGAWDDKIGHQTSVMPSSSLTGGIPNDDDTRWSVNAAIKLFEQAGFKRDRLLMGIANYGRGFKSLDLTINQQGALGGTKTSTSPSSGTFESGVVEGYDLWRNVAGEDLQGRGDFALYSDFEAHADVYFNKVTGDYISIDTARTAYMKAKLADVLGLAGAFVWTIEQDDGRIVTAMQDGFGLNGDVPSERAITYSACGIPFKDDEENLCAELYSGLNNFSSGSGSGSSIATILNAAVSLPSPGQTVRVVDGIIVDIGTGTDTTPAPDLDQNVVPDSHIIYRSELNQHQTNAESAYKESINAAKSLLRTRDNTIVEAVSPLNTTNPDNVKRVESMFNQSNWDELFSHAAPEYSYTNFLKAVAKFPALCDTYTDGRDSDAICRKSLATMFAHFVQETGKNSEYDGDTWKQGLHYVREMGWTETSRDGYNGNCDVSSDFASRVWPCGKFENGDYKSYFGRGAKQLSYNYNYGPFSNAMYGDVSVLLNNPEMVADTWLNIASAIFFYVYPQPPKPSMLSVIDGSWTPNQADIDAGLNNGFGMTIHIINGGLECGSGNEDARAQNRINYYNEFANYLSVTTPADEVLGCKNMAQFSDVTGGSGSVPIYWEQDWSSPYKCKLVNYQTAYTTFDIGGYEKCVKDKYPDVVILEDGDSPIVNDDSKDTETVGDGDAVGDSDGTDTADVGDGVDDSDGTDTAGVGDGVDDSDGTDTAGVGDGVDDSDSIDNGDVSDDNDLNTPTNALCQSFNIYPNWPANDHADGGDIVVYDDIAYKASWWTNTIPGSDDSWTLHLRCDGVEPSSQTSLKMPNPKDPIDLNMRHWPNYLSISAPNLNLSENIPSTVRFELPVLNQLTDSNHLTDHFKSLAEQLLLNEESNITILLSSDMFDMNYQDELSTLDNIPVNLALTNAIAVNNIPLDSSLLNSLSDDVKGLLKAHNLLISQLLPDANIGWQVIIGDFAYDQHSGGYRSVWNMASLPVVNLLTDYELYSGEYSAHFVAFSKSSMTPALDNDQWDNALRFIKQVTDTLNVPAMLASIPSNQAGNYFLGLTSADRKLRHAAYHNIFSIQFDTVDMALQNKIESYLQNKLPLYNSGGGMSISDSTLTNITSLNDELISVTTKMNNQVLLYETPNNGWEPSNVYKWDDFLTALHTMHNIGVSGTKFWLTDIDAIDEKNIQYAKVAIAAFLAQSMQETIQYDACDENNWAQIKYGAPVDYPMSASCGQLGQKYADYGVDKNTNLDHPYSCPRTPKIEVTATTHAKWYGAPSPIFAAPDSVLEAAGLLVNGSVGRWDLSNSWCDSPPVEIDHTKQAWERDSCNVYVGQKDGKFVWDGSSETSVEGCAWWGRGVIQTTGRRNFGTLNHFLGRSHVDPSTFGTTIESDTVVMAPPGDPIYAKLDLCSNPQLICTTEEYPELKWIAGLFFWMTSVQAYSNPGGPYESWNYYDELKKYVDDGLVGNNFIDAVSGIVNRGCPADHCETGEVHEIQGRRDNFIKVLKALGLDPK
ncbi:hypothetical protein C9J46_18860 [Photobacterium sp. GB-36]|nr:hypothetical protein C9J46_18860 [Photobacterium sp. GB-36]